MSQHKKIVSASRRTDLPGFYYDWLLNALKNGRAELVNRYNKKPYTVDLKPENVHSLALWSKDFGNVLKRPDFLENYNLYFLYTINNYPPVIEPHAPPYEDAVRVLDALLKRYRPEQFNIRFDPVLIRREKGQAFHTDDLLRARLKVFEKLCRDLAALGMNGCRITTSHISLYRHVKNRLAAKGVDIIALGGNEQVSFTQNMAEIAAKSGFSLYSCASPLLEGIIKKGSCIDAGLLEKLFGGKLSKARDGGQRKECGCGKSYDIGSYQQTCHFQCVYCYQFWKG